MSDERVRVYVDDERVRVYVDGELVLDQEPPTKIERMEISEFRSFGLLQEANRLFFHPLGLALEVIIDDDDGSERLGGIWDYRDDPEGIVFDWDTIDSKKTERVDGLRFDHLQAREELMGSSIQPAYGPRVRSDGTCTACGWPAVQWTAGDQVIK